MTKPIVYAFIDSQNLNLGVTHQSWKVDYRRLRLYLKNRYNVSRALLFIGFVPENTSLYASLTNAGFELVFKPTISYLDEGQKTQKGNVDAELVLWASAREFNNYDQAIVISADGDFRCLYEYLEEFNKLKLIISPSQRFSYLLAPFKQKVVRISRLKKVLEYKKSSGKKPANKNNQPARPVETLGVAGQNIADRRSVETLGLPQHGDTKNSVAKPHAKVKPTHRNRNNHKKKEK